jgi:tetratricopeptide (TPR) repeat protein
MNKGTIDSLLKEAKNFRKQKEFAEALAILHRVVNDKPNDAIYKYLLASTYFEADNMEMAKEYAHEIIQNDPNYKEAYELSGLINFKEEKYIEAEKEFIKALEIDPLFHNARYNLILLYFKQLKNYEKVEIHCKFMLANRDTDRNSLSQRQKHKIFMEWGAVAMGGVWYALAKQKKYSEAIDAIKEYIEFSMSTEKHVRLSQYANEYSDIYKFYYLMGDKKNQEEYKKYFLDLFKDVGGIDETCFERYEKWADDEIF